MSNTEHRGFRQEEWVLLASGLLAAVLLSCTPVETVEVQASGLPPAPAAPAPPPSEPGETFQGAVSAIDVQRSELVVAVQIVWMPVLKAERSERRVAIGPLTRWAPAGSGLPVLHAGDEIQVDAVSGPDGTWQARKIQLFDVD